MKFRKDWSYSGTIFSKRKMKSCNLGFKWNPLSWVMEAAALITIGLTNEGVLRDGKWSEEEVSVLVPRDIFALIGESLLVTENQMFGISRRFIYRSLSYLNRSLDKRVGLMVLNSIGNFWICSIAVGMVVEIIVMYDIKERDYQTGYNSVDGSNSIKVGETRCYCTAIVSILADIKEVLIIYAIFPFCNKYECGYIDFKM
ncbi:Hypothetical predicted protein [Olea europaea subsp. europaea]|uniref:Uncharacterized protein n=1 Tax=Olea europaea subsp. europaea TaxID=158383 RepID=A0A8S0QBP8_OLEEU|nr:Hypothetical predicted protein [Olea europaea subsp. europaea]